VSAPHSRRRDLNVRGSTRRHPAHESDSGNLPSKEVLRGVRCVCSSRESAAPSMLGTDLGDRLKDARAMGVRCSGNKKAICWPFKSPLTDSNRRPPPYHPKRLPWVATGCRSAYLSGFRRPPICHRLPPVAPARLHKRSILLLRSLMGKGIPRAGIRVSGVDHLRSREGVIVRRPQRCLRVVTRMNSFSFTAGCAHSSAGPRLPSRYGRGSPGWSVGIGSQELVNGDR
jgi:hypothetical protein